MLIVDDCQVNVVIAEVVLLAEQFEVETAADGLEALQKVASFEPELILMDMQIPGKDGLEMTRELKADPATQHIRIIAFTASAMRGDEAKIFAAGCDGHLSKPIDVRTFGAQVRAFLEASSGHPGDPGDLARTAQ